MHTNKQNGKVYIGISQNIENRWRPSAYKGCLRFFQAIKKYGWENFDHKILADNLTKEEAEQKEIETIKLYNSTNKNYGYNIAFGGNATMFGRKQSKEAREKISKELKNKYKGRHFSPKSEYKVGHTFTKETLLKMSLAKKNKPSWNKGLKGYNSGDKNPMKRAEVRAKFMGANNSCARGVIQYDLSGNEISQYLCITDACKTIGKAQGMGNIVAVCNGRLKTAYGYKWAYIKEII